MVEIKPVVTEKYDFEYRKKSIKTTVFSFRDYRDFDATNNLKNFPIKSSSPGLGFLIKTLLKEIKPVVTQENEYDYRDITKSIFRSFWTIRILLRG